MIRDKHQFKALLSSFGFHALLFLIIIIMGQSVARTDNLLIVDFRPEGPRDIGPKTSNHVMLKSVPESGFIVHKKDIKSREKEHNQQRTELHESINEPALKVAPNIEQVTASETRVLVSSNNEQGTEHQNKQGQTAQMSFFTNVARTLDEQGGHSDFTGKGIKEGAGGDSGSYDPDSIRKKRYLKENFAYIRDLIQEKVIYPKFAKQMGWEGKVTVSFIIVSDGHTKDIEVKESSGRDVFDKSAIETIRIASPFPTPPTEAQIIIPILYRLN